MEHTQLNIDIAVLKLCHAGVVQYVICRTKLRLILTHTETKGVHIDNSVVTIDT